jgi:hypothetical protein
MSKRVYGWDQNPATDRFQDRCSNSSANFAVETGRGIYIVDGDGRQALQLYPPAAVLAERNARNGITPFGRGPVGLYNAPPKLNYPVPAVGDHRLAWLNSFLDREKRAGVSISA